MEVIMSCVDEIASIAECEWVDVKTELDKTDRTIYLHNSDRTTFKRCRRKWDFSSPFRKNLRTKVENHKPFWFGSAIHFAFEDYHGYNRFGSLNAAFDAYTESFNPADLPDDIDELKELGHNMLDHYGSWIFTLEDRFETVWIDGKPQVEVTFDLLFEDLTELAPDGIKIAYGGTFDRVVQDKDGKWYILDYKTAKVFDTAKLPTDQQISAYLWAAEQIYQREFEGFVYVQLHKSPPKPPKLLKNGKVSTAKLQRTTKMLYLRKLQEVYGYEDYLFKASEEELDYLLNLDKEYNENQNLEQFGDCGLLVSIVHRSQTHIENTYDHIIAEGKEMINPDLPIYPNFTKDCSWDCQFKDACLALEDVGDCSFYMDGYEQREEDNDDDVKPWRLNLYRQHPDKYPEEQYRFKTSNDLEEFILSTNE